MELEFPYPELGRRIKTRRQSLKKNQDELAKRLNLTRSSIANIESGRQRILIHQLYIISEVLGISLFDLLPDNDQSNVASDLPMPESISDPHLISQIEKVFKDD